MKAIEITKINFDKLESGVISRKSLGKENGLSRRQLSDSINLIKFEKKLIELKEILLKKNFKTQVRLDPRVFINYRVELIRLEEEKFIQLDTIKKDGMTEIFMKVLKK